MDDPYWEMDRGSTILLIVLGLSAVFNTIDCGILLNCLSGWDVPSVVVLVLPGGQVSEGGAERLCSAFWPVGVLQVSILFPCSLIFT